MAGTAAAFTASLRRSGGTVSPPGGTATSQRQLPYSSAASHHSHASSSHASRQHQLALQAAVESAAAHHRTTASPTFGVDARGASVDGLAVFDDRSASWPSPPAANASWRLAQNDSSLLAHTTASSRSAGRPTVLLHPHHGDPSSSSPMMLTPGAHPSMLASPPMGQMDGQQHHYYYQQGTTTTTAADHSAQKISPPGGVRFSHRYGSTSVNPLGTGSPTTSGGPVASSPHQPRPAQHPPTAGVLRPGFLSRSLSPVGGEPSVASSSRGGYSRVTDAYSGAVLNTATTGSEIPPPPPPRSAIDYVVGTLLRSGEWRVVVDEETWRPYYFNSRDHSVTWDLAAVVRSVHSAELLVAKSPTERQDAADKEGMDQPSSHPANHPPLRYGSSPPLRQQQQQDDSRSAAGGTRTSAISGARGEARSNAGGGKEAATASQAPMLEKELPYTRRGVVPPPPAPPPPPPHHRTLDADSPAPSHAARHVEESGRSSAARSPPPAQHHTAAGPRAACGGGGGGVAAIPDQARRLQEARRHRALDSSLASTADRGSSGQHLDDHPQQLVGGTSPTPENNGTSGAGTVGPALAELRRRLQHVEEAVRHQQHPASDGGHPLANHRHQTPPRNSPSKGGASLSPAAGKEDGATGSRSPSSSDERGLPRGLPPPPALPHHQRLLVAEEPPRQPPPAKQAHDRLLLRGHSDAGAKVADESPPPPSRSTINSYTPTATAGGSPAAGGGPQPQFNDSVHRRVPSVQRIGSATATKSPQRILSASRLGVDQDAQPPRAFTPGRRLQPDRTWQDELDRREAELNHRRLELQRARAEAKAKRELRKGSPSATSFRRSISGSLQPTVATGGVPMAASNDEPLLLPSQGQAPRDHSPMHSRSHPRSAPHQPANGGGAKRVNEPGCEGFGAVAADTAPRSSSVDGLPLPPQPPWHHPSLATAQWADVAPPAQGKSGEGGGATTQAAVVPSPTGKGGLTTTSSRSPSI